MHVWPVTRLTEESEPFCSIVGIKTQQEVQVLLLQLTQLLMQIASNASARCSNHQMHAVSLLTALLYMHLHCIASLTTDLPIFLSSIQQSAQ